jgi:AraC-like DNA-binding protein
MTDGGNNKEHDLNLAYAGPASGRQYEHWREEIGRRVLRLDFEPMSDGAVCTEVGITELPGLVLASCSGSALRVKGYKAMAHPTLVNFPLLLASNSPMRVVQESQSIELGRADIGLIRTARDTAIAQLSSGGFDSILIPRAPLLARCPNAEDRVMRPLGAAPGLVSLMQGYYRLIARLAPRLDAYARNAAAQHLIDLAALALGAGGDEAKLAAGRGLAAARLAAVKAEIFGRLSRPDLSIGAIAKLRQISERYIQMLFAREGTSFGEFVLEQRLMLALKLLQDGAGGDRKVSAVAYAAGFNDLSYFHRAFRRRFGDTPAGARARAPDLRRVATE